MKKFIVAIIAATATACTAEHAAAPSWSYKHESTSPPQAKEEHQADAGATNSDLYLTEPIDMDAAVDCVRYPDTHICVTDATVPNTFVPSADASAPRTTEAGYLACAKYHFYMFSVVHPGQGYTLPEGACDYGWAPFSDVLADECVAASDAHINDPNWIDYVRGTCQPSYVAGTL